MDNMRIAENIAFIVFFGALNTIFIGLVSFFVVLYLSLMNYPINLNMIIAIALLLIFTFTFAEVSLYKRNLNRAKAEEQRRWDEYGVKGYKTLIINNECETVQNPDDVIKMSRVEEPVKMVINNEGKIIEVNPNENTEVKGKEDDDEVGSDIGMR